LYRFIVLAQQNFANSMTLIPFAISSLIHSTYAIIYVFIVKKF